MTEKIYLKDAYAKQLVAKVSKVTEDGVLLNRTIFYPTGGGQPCDTGTLKSVATGKAYEVVETKKFEDDVIHILKGSEKPTEGEELNCEIDWPKRYAHMKLHTLLHIVDGIVYKKHKGKITGGQIYDDKARMDFDVPGMDKDMVNKIIEETQSVINEHHPVNPKFLSRGEAMAIKGLARTAPGEELMKKLDVFRVIDIEGFDFQLDGGTHVSNTKEIGKVIMLKFENKGSHNKRVEMSIL